MLCFFPLVSRAEMSLSISANTNFYEYIQMHFLHIVVETVLNSRQRTFLDLVDRFFLQRESDRFYFVNGTLALPSIGLRWSYNIHISDTSINQQRKHRPTFNCCPKTDFWQIESLDLRQWVGVVCYRAKKVIPPLHVTLVRLIELSLLKNRADTWFLISSDILVSMDANWKESGKGELTSGNTPIEVSFASKVPFLQYFQFTFKNQVCAPKTSSLVQDSCTSQANEQIVHLRSSTFISTKYTMKVRKWLLLLLLASPAVNMHSGTSPFSLFKSSILSKTRRITSAVRLVSWQTWSAAQ